MSVGGRQIAVDDYSNEGGKRRRSINASKKSTLPGIAVEPVSGVGMTFGPMAEYVQRF
jgi:hypothetical protein